MKLMVRQGRKWDRRRIRALRQHLGLTQGKLAARLGIRQQTVSEWETGRYEPRGSSETLLSMVAEQSGFTYGQKEEPARRPKTVTQ
jgi:DNA-binding transcriptional regulator YiaG